MEILKFHSLRTAFWGIVLLAAVLFTFPVQSAEKVRLQESKIKAGLLYNFLKYTSWPEGRTVNADSSLHVCLYGGDAFEGALYPLSGRTAQTRMINVRIIRSLKMLSSCHLVFINKNKESELENILEDSHNQGVMTLSDIKDFSKRGGMVEFAKGNDHRIHLFINNHEIEKAGLALEGRLLKLAKLVR